MVNKRNARKQQQAVQARKPLDQHDVMVPDPQVCQEFGITSMTLLRWTRDKHMNFPPPIKFSDRPNSRNYRSRIALEAFKQRMLERAITIRHRARDVTT
jgi:predicted DNA-binding transcriptional regulator AlpA